MASAPNNSRQKYSARPRTKNGTQQQERGESSTKEANQRGQCRLRRASNSIVPSGGREKSGSRRPDENMDNRMEKSLEMDEEYARHTPTCKHGACFKKHQSRRAQRHASPTLTVNMISRRGIVTRTNHVQRRDHARDPTFSGDWWRGSS